MKHPLAVEFQKLSESSKHAVADGNSYKLDEFRQYLHIERYVEKELIENINACYKSSKSQLLLVCGNVGDGKSHILSHLKMKLKDKFAEFTIHNDATESFNPNESSNDTLNNVLDGFRDENIEQSSDKIILAINLGTLSNFLETNRESYSLLKNYVAEYGILDSAIIHKKAADDNSPFKHVNFTDYHMYSLTAEGPKSKIISTLLERLISDKPDNSIYQAYKAIKTEQWSLNCPIRYNYEFLIKEENREALMNLVVQLIVKNKEIVSVRSLFNFFYDLIVPVGLNWENLNNYQEQITKLSGDEYLSLLTPNYLFEHPELSKLFLTLEKLDPCKYRYEGLDASLIKLINAEKPSIVYSEVIGNDAIERLKDKIDKRDSAGKRELKPEVLTKLFMRLNFFYKRKDIAELSDPYFEAFMSDLYFFNNNKMSEVKNIYDLAEEASRRWYGDPKRKNKVVLNIGKNQSKYRVFKAFKAKPVPARDEEIKEETLTKFVQNFNLRFKLDNIKDPVVLEIDFSLYDILKRILKGYRPNKKDNNNHIAFVNFINKLINQDNEAAPLEIDEINIGKVADYELITDNFGGYKFRAL